MKKLISVIILILLLSSCSKVQIKNTPSASANAKTKKVDAVKKEESTEKIKAICVDANCSIDFKTLKDMQFNTIVLTTEGVRTVSQPYKTDFKTLKKLETEICTIKNAGFNYIIRIVSGPGISSDFKTSTVFTSHSETVYYSKMINEITGRHADDKYFKGISIDIGNPAVAEDSYYKTLNSIILKVRNKYDNVSIIYNLHPLSFENGFKNLPNIWFKNTIINSKIYLSALSYPGYGAAYKTSIKLNKNDIVDKFQNMKDFKDKQKLPCTINIEIPWADKSDVMLQDIYETSKMFDFDTVIYCGSTNDLYDFSNNQDVIKVITRHNSQE